MNLKARTFAAAAVTVLISAGAGAAPPTSGVPHTVAEARRQPAKDDVIPLIEMENVPLADAIRQLARQAHLNALLDPRLSEPPFKQQTVSIRWRDVTAREALVALLDNYGLVLVE